MSQCQYCGMDFADDCTGRALQAHTVIECRQWQLKTAIDNLRAEISDLKLAPSDPGLVNRGALEHAAFKECPACASQPGTPTLCPSCVQNRATIGRLESRISSLTRERNKETQDRIDALERAEKAERDLSTEKARIAALNDIHTKTVEALTRLRAAAKTDRPLPDQKLCPCTALIGGKRPCWTCDRVLYSPVRIVGRGEREAPQPAGQKRGPVGWIRCWADNGVGSIRHDKPDAGHTIEVFISPPDAAGRLRELETQCSRDLTTIVELRQELADKGAHWDAEHNKHVRVMKERDAANASADEALKGLHEQSDRVAGLQARCEASELACQEHIERAEAAEKERDEARHFEHVAQEAQDDRNEATARAEAAEKELDEAKRDLSESDRQCVGAMNTLDEMSKLLRAHEAFMREFGKFYRKVKGSPASVMSEDARGLCNALEPTVEAYRAVITPTPRQGECVDTSLSLKWDPSTGFRTVMDPAPPCEPGTCPGTYGSCPDGCDHDDDDPCPSHPSQQPRPAPAAKPQGAAEWLLAKNIAWHVEREGVVWVGHHAGKLTNSYGTRSEAEEAIADAYGWTGAPAAKPASEPTCGPCAECPADGICDSQLARDERKPSPRSRVGWVDTNKFAHATSELELRVTKPVCDPRYAWTWTFVRVTEEPELGTRCRPETPSPKVAK